MIDASNRNTLWASILVDELARCGVRHAVIAPGSRSTPLAVAFSRDERFIIHPIIDERAAAFFALGIAKASGMPAAVVCTSGTAAANFFPAIIEASMSHVPMVVMTADRPHELRDSGANQTIDQVKLYGGYVRWFVDVAPPHANPAEKTLRYLRTTVDRAVAAAQGPNGGPVHLNVPFEKPLEPVYVEGDVPDDIRNSAGLKEHNSANNLTLTIKANGATLYDLDFDFVIRPLLKQSHGLIICGPNTPEFLHQELSQFARITGYPILADPLSHMRFNRAMGADNHMIGGYESFLYGEFAIHTAPNLIIQIGSLPVGTALLAYLAKHQAVQRVVISESGDWADDLHTTDVFIQASPYEVLGSINNDRQLRETCQPDPSWLELFRLAEQATWAIVDDFAQHETTEGDVLQDILTALPEEAVLIAGNSNPIRHTDQFGQPLSKNLHLHANRGVSGIDGTIATSLGIAVGCPPHFEWGPAVLVIGDTALYHDLNSLHLIRRLNIPLIIVCINNDGGGIFHRLPIAEYDPPFRDLMVMPHGLTFEHAARMFDIPYTLVQMGGEFRAAFRAALESGGPMLIEVPSDAAKFEQQRKQLIDTVAQRIRESGILEKFKTKEN